MDKHNYYISVSNKFMFPATNLILTIQENDKNAVFLIGDLGLTENDISYLKKHFSAVIISLPEWMKEQIHETKWPKEYLIKLFLPWLIDKQIDRVLCLGADMLMVKPVNELFSLDFAENAYAAAIEVEGNVLTDRFPMYLDLSINNRVYVNVETLLINCKILRKDYSAEWMLQSFCKIQDSIRYYDQDFINYHFKDSIIRLPFQYNYQIREFICSDVFTQGLRDSSIVHFSTTHKPWMWTCDSRVIRIYKDMSNDKCKSTLNKTLYRSLILGRVWKLYREIIFYLRRLKHKICREGIAK